MAYVNDNRFITTGFDTVSFDAEAKKARLITYSGVTSSLMLREQLQIVTPSFFYFYTVHLFLCSVIKYSSVFIVIFPAIGSSYMSVQLLLISLEVLSLIFKDPSNKFIW